MLVRDYERAKALAKDLTDEGLAARKKRYDRIGLWSALVAIVSFFTLMWGDDLLRWSLPGFDGRHPDAFHLVTVLLPAIGIAVFWIGHLFVLERKREVIALAQQLKRESAERAG